MNYVLTGGAGNISKLLAEKLLSAGHQVTVIGRHPEHLKALTDKGARAATGSIEDADFLKKAFAGADAAYTMVPPQFVMGGLEAYQQTGVKYAEAIRAANVKHVVNLSSMGAHLPEGCGPVSGLYRVEQKLNGLRGVDVLHLRPGFFFMNFYSNLPMVKEMNLLGGNYGGSTATMYFSDPEDIAEAAAEELQNLSFKGHTVRYLVSDERKTGEVAEALGNAIGKPALPWIEFTDEQAYGGMVQAGVPEEATKKYVEMGAAMRSGKMWEDFLRHPPVPKGKIKLEDFAQRFAAAYNAG